VSNVTKAERPSTVKTPSSGPRAVLRRAGSLLVNLVGASAFALLLVVLALGAAILGGPLLVELVLLLSGR
jgi:hypothetical protein